jgi:hypothetical protein
MSDRYVILKQTAVGVWEPSTGDQRAVAVALRDYNNNPLFDSRGGIQPPPRVYQIDENGTLTERWVWCVTRPGAPRQYEVAISRPEGGYGTPYVIDKRTT